MLIGYARVSRTDQNLELQIDALQKAGVDPEYIFSDKLTGSKQNRPELKKAFSYLRSGDTLVVWKLDRLGRSLKDLVNILEDLDKKKIEFKSITEGIDTATPLGRMMFYIVGMFAEFERSNLIERTLAGIEAAKLRGRKGGRRITHPDKVLEVAQSEVESGIKTVKEVCQEYKISRGTYYRRLRER